MSDFAKLNGTAVRTTGTYHRVIDRTDGPPLTELELVVIVRGSMANRSLRQLLSQEPIIVELHHSTAPPHFEAELANVDVMSSGAGESAAYRYDLKLQETPASAARRAAERAAERASAPEPEPVPAFAARLQREAEPDDDPNAPLDLSNVRPSGDAAVWATALKQLTTPPGAKPAPPPEPPMSPVELAGIEAILTNLRLDALLDLLEVRGVIMRDEVESHYMSLVKDRFIAEATPVVGEKPAKRALRDLLGEPVGR